MTDVRTGPANGMKFLVAPADAAPLIPGRRDWVEYRDLGVEDASNGLISTHRVTVRPADGNDDNVKQTGWHYHDCQNIDLIEIFMPPNPETVPIDVPEPWRSK